MRDMGRDLCKHVCMSVSGGSDRSDCQAARGSLAVFSALVFDGARWMGIGGPHRDARTACLCVVTWVGLMEPGVPLADLRERAEVAVRALEDGAASIPVIDDRHRVDRVMLCPERRPAGVDETGSGVGA